MEQILYQRMAEHGDVHWWYSARREILARLIERRIALPADAKLLEIGCGTGPNLDMLHRFGDLDAVEIEEGARAFASERLGRPVGAAPLPALNGVPENSYDFVALLDVLEHVEDDEAALRGIARRLRPHGKLLVTVPAYQWMWSGHDVANHHFRRYSEKTLRRVFAAADMRVDMLSYFNTLLFPLAAASRIAGKLKRADGEAESDDALPPAPLNAFFRTVFGWERHLVGRAKMPFGVSIVAIVSARDSGARN